MEDDDWDDVHVKNSDDSKEVDGDEGFDDHDEDDEKEDDNDCVKKPGRDVDDEDYDDEHVKNSEDDKEVEEQFREHLLKKRMFSFGHCPNYLFFLREVFPYVFHDLRKDVAYIV